VSAWIKSIGQLKRIDGATDAQIQFVIRWLFSSGKKNALFWQKNIRSGATLREKWTQLVANCKEDYQKQGGTLNIPSNEELSSLSI
jgi:ethanolamine utilization protein EutP (predicted NTPase)